MTVLDLDLDLAAVMDTQHPTCSESNSGSPPTPQCGNHPPPVLRLCVFF